MTAPDNKDGKTGRLIVVSGPSGAGKSTIISRVLARRPDLAYAVSVTTRPRRGQERNGVDYHFVSEETFQEKIQLGELAEWARVHGHYYGTCARFIEAQRRDGTGVVVDVDTQGAKSLLSKYRDAISIFVSPPTMEILQERLVSRGTETREAIDTRLENARKEMKQMDQYTHVLVNDDAERAVSEFLALLNETRIHE